jgi:hypothetical protein
MAPLSLVDAREEPEVVKAAADTTARERIASFMVKSSRDKCACVEVASTSGARTLNFLDREEILVRLSLSFSLRCPWSTMGDKKCVRDEFLH